MTIRKSTLMLGVCLLAAGAMLATAFGQAAPGGATPAVRLAVIDMGEVLTQYNRSKDLEAEYSNRAKTLNEEDEKRITAAQKLGKELEQLNPTSDEFQKRYAELEKTQLELRNWRDWQDSSLRRWRINKMRDLYLEVAAAVEKTAKDRGIQTVLRRDQTDLTADDVGQLQTKMAFKQVIYSASETDITTLVLKRLQDAYQGKGK